MLVLTLTAFFALATASPRCEDTCVLEFGDRNKHHSVDVTGDGECDECVIMASNLCYCCSAMPFSSSLRGTPSELLAAPPLGGPAATSTASIPRAAPTLLRRVARSLTVTPSKLGSGGNGAEYHYCDAGTDCTDCEGSERGS